MRFDQKAQRVIKRARLLQGHLAGWAERDNLLLLDTPQPPVCTYKHYDIEIVREVLT